jgi:hypothetical protein
MGTFGLHIGAYADQVKKNLAVPHACRHGGGRGVFVSRLLVRGGSFPYKIINHHADAVMTDSGFFLFGVASNNVLYASYRYTGGTFPYPNAHNGIINQAVYFGVPCMIIYLMMIYKAVSSLTKGSDSQLMASPQVVRFAMASVIALVGDYFFEPASEGVLLQGQFFFLLALCLILTAKPVKYFSSTSLQQRHANILGAIK